MPYCNLLKHMRFLEVKSDGIGNEIRVILWPRKKNMKIKQPPGIEAFKLQRFYSKTKCASTKDFTVQIRTDLQFLMILSPSSQKTSFFEKVTQVECLKTLKELKIRNHLELIDYKQNFMSTFGRNGMLICYTVLIFTLISGHHGSLKDGEI